MKTLKLIGVGLLLSLLFASYAGAVELTSITQTKEMFSVTLSSSTGTAILPIDTARIAFTISNPSSSYSIYLSTYAITAAEITTGKAWMRILPGCSYFEETNAAWQAIYGLTQAGQTAIVVSGELRKK